MYIKYDFVEKLLTSLCKKKCRRTSERLHYRLTKHIAKLTFLWCFLLRKKYIRKKKKKKKTQEAGTH